MDIVETDTLRLAALKLAAEQHGDPTWLIDKRVAAAVRIKNLLMPRIQRFNYRNWELMQMNLRWQMSTLMPEVPTGTVQIVQVGQTTLRMNLPEELQQQGVILTDIFTAAQKYPALVKANLMTKTTPNDEHRLASYHLAYLNAGIFFYIPDDVALDDPIDIQIIQDSTRETPLISHILGVVGKNSHVVVNEHLTTVGTRKNVMNCITEIIAQENSQVTVTAIDELGADTTAYIERHAYASDHAIVDWAMGLMNKGHTIANFDTDLNGVGAQADTKIVAVTANDQRMGVNTKITNRGQHTTGHILQHGVILGTSELVYNGIGDIIHGASGSKAEQENRLLMMSDEAHGNANPILLIDENDVLAGHSASVGQVDEKQLYYLMSRGLQRKSAERLVIRGFLGAVLSAIPNQKIRQQLVGIIERKLQNDQS